MAVQTEKISRRSQTENSDTTPKRWDIEVSRESFDKGLEEFYKHGWLVGIVSAGTAAIVIRILAR